MAYEKQNFKDGDILYAAQMNHIENGIEAVETDIKNMGNSKGDAGAIDLTSYTIEDIVTWIGTRPGQCFAGRTKLSAEHSPLGNINWFRCLWESQNVAIEGDNGLSVIAMNGTNIWYGFIDKDSSNNYILHWDKLVKKNEFDELNSKIKSGYITTKLISAKEIHTFDVVFPKQFNNMPRIVCTPIYHALDYIRPLTYGINNVTTGGFTLSVCSDNAGSNDVNLEFYWIALDS